MKDFFAYIRVSTVRQGERGSSLQEQRDAIAAYARRNTLTIGAWYQEMVTATKHGRREFSQMLRLLQNGAARGVIFHKIDRGARNLKDWADIQELIERGVEVRFAHESLDLQCRNGRLSADILAVVAADYVRNLREEVCKGFYGRLKQGLYPLPAPLGYQDRGSGVPKEPDPKTAPLVSLAFDLYSSARFSLNELSDEMRSRGLRSKSGRPLDAKRLGEMFRRPFYMGLIHISRTNETFAGIHQPLVGKALFDRVQAVLDGRIAGRNHRHAYLFRRLIKCKVCGYALIGETQKGRVYYRCHTRSCTTTSIREDVLDSEITVQLNAVDLDDGEAAELRDMVSTLKEQWGEQRTALLQGLTLTRQRIDERLLRLTDAYLDGVIDQTLFEARKRAFLMEQKAIDDQVTKLSLSEHSVPEQIAEFLELAKTLSLSYRTAIPDEKRKILKSVTSNFLADRKNVVVELRSPFQEIANRPKSTNGGPYRRSPRTFTRQLFEFIVSHFSSENGRAKEREVA